MAKGNMLQGMARGKVGDVVFSRLNGEQISRVRNRYPKNPRTNAQLYQRAIMATIMQAYSAGKVIFDHAFQGKAVGAENQRRFMSLNAKLLRSQIANDINDNVEVASQVGRVVAPGTIMPVPAELTISEGSYDQALFELVEANGLKAYQLTEKQTNEKLKDYAARVGLIPGDIYTLVAFSVCKDTSVWETPETSDGYGTVRECQFTYMRMTVKDSVLTSESTSITYLDIFDIESSSNAKAWQTTAFNDKLTINTIKPISFGENSVRGCIGLIRSRKDRDVRSNSQLIYIGNNSSIAADNFNYGIASSYILNAWTSGTQALGDSDLLLEGGNFAGKEASASEGD